MADSLLGDEQLELAALINATVDNGVIVHGGVTIAIADIDLIKLDLGLMLIALETVLQREGGPSGSLAAALPPPNLTRRPRGVAPTAANARDALARAARPPMSAQGTPAPDHLPAGTVAGKHPGIVEEVPGRSDVPTAELSAMARGLPERINADPDHVENGLARLVLTLIEVLRKVLEHQAVRRMDGGTLSDAEVERLGLALLRLSDRVREMKGVFGLSDEDLNIDLGPLGRLR